MCSSMFVVSLLVGLLALAQPSSGACLPDAVSPANGSVVARFAGSEDQVQLNCNIVCDGTRQPATWTLENYMKMDKEVFILNGNIPNITVTGDPRSDTGTRTFRNTLIIHQFAEELSGTVLRCKFSDFIAVFFLETYRPPRLRNVSVDVLLHSAVDASLSLSQDATPYPQMWRWSRSNGQEVSNSSTTALGYPTASFSNVSFSDGGQYLLTAANHVPNDPSQVIGLSFGYLVLNVLFGPEVDPGPSEVRGAVDHEVLLVCAKSVRSNPPPSVIWTDNRGNAVDLSEDRFSVVSDFVLAVSSLALLDTGMWMCVVNVSGVSAIHHAMQLVVINRPPPPSNVTLADPGSNSVRVAWSAARSSASPGSCYNVTATDPSGSVISSLTEKNSMSTIIRGLRSYTVYNVSVSAVVQVGDVLLSGQPSNPILFTTQATAPQLECRVAVAPNGSLVVQWRFTDLGGSNLRLRAFYQVGVAGDLRQVLEVQDVRDDGPMAVVLDNVTAGWTYQFTIEARNQVGGTNTSCYSTPSMGLPQVPKIHTSRSSGGKVVLQVSTIASGTSASGDFRFFVRAQHHTLSEALLFTHDARGYLNNEVLELELSGFSRVEPTYTFYISCQNGFGQSNESTPLVETVQFGSFPDALVGGVAVGVAVISSVVVIVVILLCLYRRKRCKQRRTIYLHDGELGDSVPPAPNLQEDIEDTQRTQISPLTPQVRRLNTSSSHSSSASPNRADGGGEVSKPHHKHDRSSISLSSGTGSESTHDRYPILVSTGTAESPMAPERALVVQSNFSSPNRMLAVKYQQKPLAINPLSHTFMEQQDLPLRDQAFCRNMPHLLRQSSVACGAPSSTSDLRSPLSRQFTNASLGQMSLSGMPATVSPRTEVRPACGLSMPHVGGYHASVTKL